MKLQVSRAVGKLLEQAAARSIAQGSYFVGVEHVFAVLLEESDQLPAPFTARHLNDLFAAARRMQRTQWRGALPTAQSGDPFYTPRCIETANRAAKVAERLSRGAAEAGHLLLALLSDPLAAPSRAIDALGLDRTAMVNELRDALAGHSAAPRPVLAGAGTSSAIADAPLPRHEDSSAAAPAGGNGGAAATPSLERLTRDLSAAARAGKLQPAIAREDEIFEVLQILARQSKNNVMLVGEAGVGKTQLLEGLALRAYKAREKPGDRTGDLLADYRFLELNLAALMAGTQYRGAFEEKLIALLDELKRSPNTILFIDEVHLIMGAGATDGDSIDFANLIKPALARGEIRAIGATTLREYRKFVERDPAIERRFQMVRVEPLSEEGTRQVLDKLRPVLERHHGVTISERCVDAAITLSQRYMPNRALPDKAIDVLDQSCARFRLKAIARGSNPGFDSNPEGEDNTVTPYDVRKVVSQMAGVPLDELTAQERLQLSQLDQWLGERLIGQDEAIDAVVSVVKKSRAGMSDPNRPDAVLLFIGPTGVGKTEMARLLADAVFGSPKHLVQFNMSEYIESHSVSRLLGAPPGYQGSDEEGLLAAAVRSTPYCVLLFDEIEKAHPQIFDIFLPIFDEGRTRDSRGREISFRNCIIILTSNVAAQSIAHGGGRGEWMGELRTHFRPEFLNRIDEIVPFHPLLSEDIRSILRLEVNRLRGRLKEKRVGVRMYQRAYEYLAAQAFCPEYGARELRRVVEQRIATAISDLLISEQFQPGDMIDVLMEDDELVVRRGPPHHSVREART